MKYGRLVFTREFVSPILCNAGDVVQSLAIDGLYEKMNIAQEDIIDIPMEQLSSYRGEKVVLPLNGYFLYSREYPSFPVSEDIIPVFLGIFSTSPAYLKHRKFWKKYEPIGCRDEATYQAMSKKGYKAFLLGCMTITLPKRTKEPDKPKVFLVDAHPSIMEYIPEKLKSHIEYVTHDIPVNKDMPHDDLAKYMLETSAHLYERYRDEATLVITSRLHCAAPCIAMGIPTIVVKDGFDERFGWLDKLVHLYTPDEFANIDWNPKPIDLEEHKKQLERAAISLINRTPDWEALNAVHEFYMSRKKKKLSAPILVKGYMIMAQYSPKLAAFIREKVLYRFTIAGKSQKQ